MVRVKSEATTKVPGEAPGLSTPVKSVFKELVTSAVPSLAPKISGATSSTGRPLKFAFFSVILCVVVESPIITSVNPGWIIDAKTTLLKSGNPVASPTPIFPPSPAPSLEKILNFP